MIPRQLKPHVINEKLNAIERALGFLREVGEVSRERLEEDGIIEAAVERLVCRVVELAVDVNTHIASALLGRVPSDYRTTFDDAAEAGAIDDELATALKGSAGLRNAIVHEYVTLDLTKLAAAVPLTLDRYQAYVTQVAAFATEADSAGDDEQREG